MGRLLASLLADSEPRSLATLATPATLVREVAESQKSPASRIESRPSGVAESQESQRVGAIAQLYERMEALAYQVGADIQLVRELPPSYLDDLLRLMDGTDAPLLSYLHVLRDEHARESGQRLPNETSLAVCSHCGPVWVAANVAAVSPHVGGVARVAGCAWCTNRGSGTRIPRPAVTCGSCEHFERDTINPPAGIGRCRLGVATGPLPYPFAERTCASWRPSTDAEPSA